MSDERNTPPAGLVRADDQRVADLKVKCERYEIALNLLTNGFKYSTEVCGIARWALVGESETASTPSGFRLTQREIRALAETPDALTALEDWHEVQATEADGMDMVECVAFHDKRKAEIRAEIERVQAEPSLAGLVTCPHCYAVFKR